MDEVELMTVIKTTLLRKGRGTQDDPVRIIEQFWKLNDESKKCELLFEIDPCPASSRGAKGEVGK